MNIPPRQTQQKNIIKIKNTGRYEVDDTVITEKTYNLHVNNHKVTTFTCSPTYMEELVAGFLCNEKFISKTEEITELQINHNRGEIRVTIANQQQLRKNSCLQQENTLPENMDLYIKIQELQSLGEKFQNMAKLFQKTGGAHGAALCSSEKIIVFYEDVSRHNTLDKIYGHCLINNISRHNKFIIFTGRISSTILQKTARMSIPLIASPSAPTSLALDLAGQLGITVAGFMRGTRINIYTYPERLI
ncbi:MAG: formate dehydrogenase accessory sulfurtransferase FdhD [Clostridiales bacterium]|nr:formate dehydrogenase accessory sulfurtransferase FdhD [Clostridiales bacterium]MCF8022060.1 formate dehydrogenase accessory sulfurtransferase FdhD [Clostridiales bacterium]